MQFQLLKRLFFFTIFGIFTSHFSIAETSISNTSNSEQSNAESTNTISINETDSQTTITTLGDSETVRNRKNWGFATRSGVIIGQISEFGLDFYQIKNSRVQYGIFYSDFTHPRELIEATGSWNRI